MLPPLAALNIEVEVGVEEGVERALDGGLPLCGAVIIVERLHPLFDGDDRAPCEDGVEQRLLVVEIIIDQRVMDADELGDVLQRDAVEYVLRKKMFGGMDAILHRFGALIVHGRTYWQRSLMGVRV